MGQRDGSPGHQHNKGEDEKIEYSGPGVEEQAARGQDHQPRTLVRTRRPVGEPDHRKENEVFGTRIEHGYLLSAPPSREQSQSASLRVIFSPPTALA